MGIKIRNMKSNRSGNEVKNQVLVLVEDGEKTVGSFFSYETLIFSYEVNEDDECSLMFSRKYDYSKTTIAYRNQALEQISGEKVTSGDVKNWIETGEAVFWGNSVRVRLESDC